MEDVKYREVWNIDTLFKGGSHSRPFQDHIEKLRNKLAILENDLEGFTPSEPDT
ncbi:hypothetical protein [Virgibacillus senegalensis]|uniref:hypothetical protein n=1 Tax=Virgibacillus senegalensis TaxID=1499679 RepID=UPI000B2EEFBC|nr:hypothetical protein [Virgibacillus senegalensis]